MTPEFKFLGNIEDYSNYYKEWERAYSPKKKFTHASTIPEIGDLLPINRYHSLHSFWKWFRRPIKLANEKGKNLDELFLFLPLEIKVPINPIKINKKNEATAQFRAYLFPFGAIVTILTIKIEKSSLFELINFSKRLNGTGLSSLKSGKNTDLKNFRVFSKNLAFKICESLFGTSSIMKPFSTHKMFFIEKTEPILQFSNRFKRAIKGLMTDSELANIECETIETVNAYFSKNENDKKTDKKATKILKEKNVGEILLFNTKASFFYISPHWKHSKNGPSCMQTNYESFLSFLFGINRILQYFDVQQELSTGNYFDFRGALLHTFNKKPYSVYYKNSTPEIADSICLIEALEEAFKNWTTD